MDKVIKDMLHSRKYNYIPLGSQTTTEEKEKFKMIARGEKRNYNLEVYYSDSKDKIGVREIRTVIEHGKQEKLKVLILITIEKMTFFAQRECKTKNSSSDYPYIELWTKNELNYNVLKHFTQPRFTVLSSKEKQEVTKKIDIKRFPKLLQSDPVARFLGLQKGIMVCVDRPLPGGQTTRVYRHVC